VARLLAGQRHRVVVVERDADNRHLSQLRTAGHHVIVADAEVDATLALAGVDRAATVLALTESDASNLRIALTVRARCPDLPVVTRLGSPELSVHVAARHDGLAASSIAIGSDAFVRAVLAACAAKAQP
jgi:voltage-gated potassium channel Kch